MTTSETQVATTPSTKNEESKPAPVEPTAHFSGNHVEILDALNFAEFGIEPKAQPPAQRGVLIETGQNLLALSAYDFDTAVTVSVPASTPAAKGSSLLDFTELKKTLGAMVAGETKAVAARTRVSLAGDLLSTEHLTVPVTTHDVDTYTRPLEPVPAMATMDAQTFLGQLNRVLPAAGRDYTLPVLTGIQITLDGTTLTMATTDRYRFAVAEVAATATAQPPEKPLNALIPAATLAALAKRLKAHDGPVGIGILHADHTAGEAPADRPTPRATLSLGAVTITMRSLDGSLPTYRKLFPETCDTAIRLDRATTVRATKKCQAILTAKGLKNAPVTFVWDTDGNLTLAPRLDTAEDKARAKGMPVPTAITHGTGETLHGGVAAFNPSFLLDVLNTFTGDTVTLHLGEMKNGQLNKPALFTAGPEMSGQGYRHLLMHIRLA
ncbi:DNA polymerase III subunit beta [Streptomyces antarcticus]|uniref:DNA polymerase III subunit beta n=1 Tax=Streptomyces antarcticus TaxID=2996458 RepID=UPI00226F1BD6|nr:DNA polymerase III subunit beta [Streptomyces sp. H34-AA3]MCY0945685.1 DNA polymerase III subunit beta [Streptomyces sp. H34-AA3]